MKRLGARRRGKTSGSRFARVKLKDKNLFVGPQRKQASNPFLSKERLRAKLPVPETLNGGLSVVCHACDLYLELANKYGVDNTTAISNEAINWTQTEQVTEDLNVQKQERADNLSNIMSIKS